MTVNMVTSGDRNSTMLYIYYIWGKNKAILNTPFPSQLTPRSNERSGKVTRELGPWVSQVVTSGWGKWRTYCPSEKFQSSELEGVLFGHSKLRDYNEAEGHNEGENVELQKPPQKVEIGEDAGSELASDDLKRLLPKANRTEQFQQAVFRSPVCLGTDTKHVA